MTALCWLFLMGSGSLPTGRFFLLTLASFVLVAAVRELGLGGAFSVYLASSLLTLIWPGFVTALLFAFSFGLIPLMTFCFRRWFKPFWSQVLTQALMTGLFFLLISILGLDRFFKLDRLPLSYALWVLLVLLALQVYLLLYAWALAYFEKIYRQKIGPWIRRKD